MNLESMNNTFETDLAVFWFDEQGILCAKAKSTPRTIENQKETYDIIKRVSNFNKVCLLSIVTDMPPQSKEVRDYIAKELPNVFKAMAVVSESEFGEMVANTFTHFNQPIPIRLFGDEAQAKEWLKTFM